jgi:hypothetical protein
VLPGHSFALVVFTNPAASGSDVLVFSATDWVVPGDGSTLIFGSEITQLNSESTPDFSFNSASEEPPNANWYSEAVDLGSGWRWLNWLGSFNVSNDPWIYHAQHGWLYPFADGPESVYFWDNEMGAFLWTSEMVYPSLYRFSDGQWLFYQKGSSNPRWFVNLITGEWEAP